MGEGSSGAHGVGCHPCRWSSCRGEKGSNAKVRKDPSRGEVWLADLDPTRGHEEAGLRPVLVLSVDTFNHGPAGLVIVLPVTSTHRGIAAHVPLNPPEGGVKVTSFVLCDAIRSITKERLVRKWGAASPATLVAVEDRVRILLGL